MSPLLAQSGHPDLLSQCPLSGGKAYHVPVNADTHDIKVIFVDEPDDSNPLGVKGVGEVGIVGVAAAIANAVYHARQIDEVTHAAIHSKLW